MDGSRSEINYRVPSESSPIMNKRAAYVIQSFCLGHSAYVSSLAINDGHLFSSGGDGFVHEWDVESGTSVAQSQKLGEEPIRRIRTCKKDNKVFLAAITQSALTLLDEKLAVTKSFTTADSLMDITPFKEHIIGVSSNGVVSFDLSNGTSRSVQVPTELLELLAKSKDPIPSYFKNVTHQNMLDYYKRKAEKIESTKENQIRKRKARQSRKAAAKLKKIANEPEVTAAC
ncbi:WD domain, G-beta repeat protein [Teladorsagia circumcincta]|uniref:WD domain, G-beta repeat protein n=1 Tax=Teladorsagia circumcincta TaxID=45464 RepID=A0A2G9U003_TELCI|nr:WD domain, G-beta repeat protein [Teladorsagia circumcincta]